MADLKMWRSGETYGLLKWKKSGALGGIRTHDLCLRRAVTESPKLDREVRGMAVPYNRLNMLVPFGVDRGFWSISTIGNETYRIKGQYRLRQHWHSCISAGSDKR